MLSEPLDLSTDEQGLIATMEDTWNSIESLLRKLVRPYANRIYKIIVENGDFGALEEVSRLWRTLREPKGSLRRRLCRGVRLIIESRESLLARLDELESLQKKIIKYLFKNVSIDEKYKLVNIIRKNSILISILLNYNKKNFCNMVAERLASDIVSIALNLFKEKDDLPDKDTLAKLLDAIINENEFKLRKLNNVRGEDALLCLVAISNFSKALRALDAKWLIDDERKVSIACMYGLYLRSVYILEFLDNAFKKAYGVGFIEYLSDIVDERSREEFLDMIIEIAPSASLGERIYAYFLRILADARVASRRWEEASTGLAYAARVFLEANVDRVFLERLVAYAYLYSKPTLIVKVAFLIKAYGWPEASGFIKEILRGPASWWSPP